MNTVVSYGNPVYDLISTPSLRSTERVLSGCSTNACLALSKLGQASFLIGSAGDDYRGALQDQLGSHGIGYKLYPSSQTGGFSLYYYDDAGNRELSILGVANQLDFEPLPVLSDAAMILLGPILGEVTKDLGKKLSQNVTAPILLDPQGTLRSLKDGKVVHGLSEDFIELARISEIVKANELETETVTGIAPRTNLAKSVEKLHAFGAAISIVTLADAGSIIFDGNDLIEIPSYRVNAIDPTGAGDTYAAGFCYQYLQDPTDLRRAGCFGSAVASVMVENTGPDFPLTLDEATRRANQLIRELPKVRI